MSKKGAALGRGLNALLPSVQPAPEEEEREEGDVPRTRLYNFEERVRFLGRVAEIEVEHIRPNPYQPRRDFDEHALDELAASIVQLGIIQPITVRALGGGQFEVISGERRLRAARRAGLRRIPAYVREADTEAMLEMAIVENVQREALNPVEIALGYQRLIEECGLTQEEVAQKVGKNRATVANFIRLLKLPPRVQATLRDGSLTVGHARALLGLETEAQQYSLLRRILEDNLSVRDVEDAVRAASASDAPAGQTSDDGMPAPPSRDDLQVRALADRLRTRLSTQVAIKHRGDKGGRIEIAYYSNEDLERLLELLGA